MSDSSTHEADTSYLVRQSMNTGYQWTSLLMPPAYIGYVIARRGRGELSINRVLRATWMGGLGGAAVAGSLSYARYAYTSTASVNVRRLETTYDTNILRRNDHATIGGVLMAILTPAILWKQAGIINLILGGSGIGTGAGLLVHYGRSLAGDHPPKVDIPIPVISDPSKP